MSKYFLLSRSNCKISAVELNSGDAVAKTVDINSSADINEWILAGSECYFRVSQLPNIMYRYDYNYDPDNRDTLFIHEVEVINYEKLLDDEAGHHDGVSNFSLYEGKYADSVLIKNTYDLSQKDDLDQMIELGFFENDEGSLFRDKNLSSFFKWLVSSYHKDLFFYLYDMKPYFSIITNIVIEDRPELLKYIIEKSVVDEKDEYILEDYIDCINGELQCAAENGSEEILEILLPYASNKQESLTLGLYSAIDASNQKLIDRFLEQHVLENQRREIFNAVHYATPKEKLHLIHYYYPYIFHFPYIDGSINLDEFEELLILALACDSEELLSQLLTDELAPQGVTSITRLTKYFENEIKNTGVDLKEMVMQGNIVACQTILGNVQRKSRDDLDSCLLIAAEKGYFGIVKLLIKYGADAKTWMNYPIKFSNKHNYAAMKKYLLELGVPDERFAEDSY